MTNLHANRVVAQLSLTLILAGLSCQDAVCQENLAPLIDLSGLSAEPAMPTKVAVPDPVPQLKARQLTPQTIPKPPPKTPVVSFEDFAKDLEKVDEKEAAGFRALEESIRSLDGSIRDQRSRISMERKKTELAIRAADALLKRMLLEEQGTKKDEPPETTPSQETSLIHPPPILPENTDPPSDVTSDAGPTLSPDDEVLLKGTMRAITTREVDRLALADNLFAAGKHAVSLRVYERLLPDTTTPREMAWLHLQIGNIYRNAKNYEESEKHYRIVTGLGPDTPYYEYARWWLVTLKQGTVLEEKTRRLRTAIAKIQGSQR